MRNVSRERKLINRDGNNDEVEIIRAKEENVSNVKESASKEPSIGKVKLVDVEETFFFDREFVKGYETNENNRNKKMKKNAPGSLELLLLGKSAPSAKAKAATLPENVGDAKNTEEVIAKEHVERDGDEWNLEKILPLLAENVLQEKVGHVDE